MLEPYSEDKWQRESDARTLAQAKQIQADKKRHSGAKKAAKKLAERAVEEAAAMNSVAKKKKSTIKPKTKKIAKRMTMAAMRKKIK